MLHKDDYRESWERKLKIYQSHGFTLGENLFTTQDDEQGGLDSTQVAEVAQRVQQVIG
jgi:hypothetical protein